MNLFVYGPLMVPEVMRAVVGGDEPRCHEAVLHGYVERRVESTAQAGLIPFPDCATEGVVFYDLDGVAMGKIDAFEGDDFERVSVSVQAENGEWVEAETHLLRPKGRKLLRAKAWDELEFRERRMAKPLRRYGTKPTIGG